MSNFSLNNKKFSSILKSELGGNAKLQAALMSGLAQARSGNFNQLNALFGALTNKDGALSVKGKRIRAYLHANIDGLRIRSLKKGESPINTGFTVNGEPLATLFVARGKPLISGTGATIDDEYLRALNACPWYDFSTQALNAPRPKIVKSETLLKQLTKALDEGLDLNKEQAGDLLAALSELTTLVTEQVTAEEKETKIAADTLAALTADLSGTPKQRQAS